MSSTGRTEIVAIQYRLHRDAAGQPTCAARWDGDRCALLLVRGGRAGGEVCGATGEWIVRDPRRGMWLRPPPSCPLWAAAATQGPVSPRDDDERTMAGPEEET